MCAPPTAAWWPPRPTRTTSWAFPAHCSTPIRRRPWSSLRWACAVWGRSPSCAISCDRCGALSPTWARAISSFWAAGRTSRGRSPSSSRPCPPAWAAPSPTWTTISPPSWPNADACLSAPWPSPASPGILMRPSAGRSSARAPLAIRRSGPRTCRWTPRAAPASPCAPAMPPTTTTAPCSPPWNACPARSPSPAPITWTTPAPPPRWVSPWGSIWPPSPPRWARRCPSRAARKSSPPAAASLSSTTPTTRAPIPCAPRLRPSPPRMWPAGASPCSATWASSAASPPPAMRASAPPLPRTISISSSASASWRGISLQAPRPPAWTRRASAAPTPSPTCWRSWTRCSSRATPFWA